MIKVGTSCRAKTILETPQPVKEQQVNISGQKALFSIKITNNGLGNRALAQAASAPGVEAADRGFEHHSTHDFHGYYSMRVWGVRVWDGVSAAV